MRLNVVLDAPRGTHVECDDGAAETQETQQARQRQATREPVAYRPRSRKELGQAADGDLENERGRGQHGAEGEGEMHEEPESSAGQNGKNDRHGFERVEEKSVRQLTEEGHEAKDFEEIEDVQEKDGDAGE